MPDASRSAPPTGTPPLEIALGLLGGAVVLGLVGFLLFSAVRGEGRGHPAVSVELMAPARLDRGSWVVPFRAVNDGRAPASQVRLEAELALPDGRRERGEVVIDYLAGGAEEAGWFLFADDPAAGRLTARALGFLRP
ncbi:MAG TPA: hypothetical protein VFY87_24845 [Geminicoccaceae bacterium]|nr:hypothetical protein [Geminicoccaceae bacterium]